MKTYLITGGSGYLGLELISRLYSIENCTIKILARDEGKLIEVKQKYPSIEIITGDVSDKFEVEQAMKGVDGVYHLAASKHIGIAEKQPRECIKSNIIGSLNILEASLNINLCPNLEFVIGISTDKAAQVNGVYGASKFLMERLFTQYEYLRPDVKYRIVRYGNVLYSTGSVLCKWKQAIIDKQPITISDPSATRFFWTVSQAVDLVFECLNNSTSPAPYIPTMKSMSIGNLLEAMIEKYSSLDYHGRKEYLKNVQITGLQAGENLHERIIENGPDSSQSERFTTFEIFNMI
jgi:UDP-N-acetylglucosamine 4,6-dehydratase/UDP-glucose 4-epimerase